MNSLAKQPVWKYLKHVNIKEWRWFKPAAAEFLGPTKVSGIFVSLGIPWGTEYQLLQVISEGYADFSNQDFSPFVTTLAGAHS